MVEHIKKVLGDKHKRNYLFLNILVVVILIIEFVMFKYGPLKIVKYIVLVEALFLIAWKDSKEKIIRNKHLLWMTGFRAFLLVVEWIIYPSYGFSILMGSLMGALIGFLVFGLCYLVSRGGMGAGDVKLVTVLGFYLGGAVIMPVMILVVLSSAIYSIVNLARKKTNLKAEIPFAPFVLLGTILAMMLGV